MRRIIKIGIAAAVLLMGVAVYYFFLGGQERFAPEEEVTTEDTAPDRPEERQLDALTSSKAISPVFSIGQDAVWYFEETGQLYRQAISPATERETSDLKDLSFTKKAFWPSQGNDFIVDVLQQGGNDIFRTYFASRQEFVSHPANMKSVAWMPNGQQIVYVWQRGDGGYELKKSDSDGQNFTTISELDMFYQPNISLSGNFALLVPVYSGQANKVLRVDLGNGEITEFLDRGINLEVKFSPDGRKVLFTRLSEGGVPEIWGYDFSSQAFSNLRVQSVLEKVAWKADSSGFYFAQPQTIALQDRTISQPTNDEIMFYDLSTGQQRSIYEASSSGRQDVRELQVSDDSSVLIFVNGNSGRLYRLRIQ